MMGFLAQIITWINVATNAIGNFAFAPLMKLPGWLSNTIISALIGVLLLIIFKYTSNQKAIGCVRDQIKANLLALKLFKDSISVTLGSQAKIFKAAFLLLFHALRPMMVMIVPICLLMAQMALWYQYRPLLPGEHATVTMELNGDIDAPWPEVNLQDSSATEVITGPVRLFSKRQICWEVKALQNGCNRIKFHLDELTIEKELAVGEGFMRISSNRPPWKWTKILFHPAEKPFGPDSLVKSISIVYPRRLSKTSGSDWWVIYFFAASMVFAFIFKPFLKVKI